MNRCIWEMNVCVGWMICTWSCQLIMYDDAVNVFPHLAGYVTTWSMMRLEGWLPMSGKTCLCCDLVGILRISLNEIVTSGGFLMILQIDGAWILLGSWVRALVRLARWYEKDESDISSGIWWRYFAQTYHLWFISSDLNIWLSFVFCEDISVCANTVKYWI